MSVLSTVDPWNLVAEGYTETMMKFFQGYVDAALELVVLRSDDDIVDVACGPGTLALTAAERVASVKAIDFSENMISMLRKGIANRGLSNIEPCEGDGQSLPYRDESFDAAFSIFGLMFFPDRGKGYAEIFRTLKPGGRICISSWAPVDRSPLMQAMFAAMRAIKPDLPEPKTDLESLENPELLRSELSAAGFRNVEVHGVTKSMPLTSAEEFWDSMVRGSAPVTMLKNSMPEDVWRERGEIAVDTVEKAAGPFPTLLSAVAWFGVAVKEV